MRQYRSNQGRNPEKENATIEMVLMFVKVMIIFVLLAQI